MHKREIPRGEYGKPSKIREEFYEFWDAVEQNQGVMQLVELANLVGAIKGYANERFGTSLAELEWFDDAVYRQYKLPTESK